MRPSPFVDDIQKLLVERNKNSPIRKQSTVEALTENLQRAVRSVSPDQENEADCDRDMRRNSLPTTPTMPSGDAQRQQEQLDRVAFLADLK